jgi:hypothetical protein
MKRDSDEEYVRAMAKIVQRTLDRTNPYPPEKEVP